MAPNALAIHAVAFRLLCHTAIELPAWILWKKKTKKKFACCKPSTWVPCTQADAFTIVLAGLPCL